MKEIKEQIQKWTQLLPTGKVVTAIEAERRASEFLVANAHIAEWIHLFKDGKIKSESMKVGVYATEMNNCPSKQVTEKKAMAEASESYLKVREEFEFIENDISYLKAFQEIFNNGHIFYRNISRENS